MFEREDIERAVDIQQRAYRLLLWMERALERGVIGPDAAGKFPSSEEAAFARHCFDFEKGGYAADYVRLLQGSLPSLFHIPYSEGNYEILRRTIDEKFARWKRPRKWWWPF